MYRGAMQLSVVLAMVAAFIGSVRAADPPDADTGASCFRGLECNFDQQIGFQTVRDCCVNDPNGASFQLPGSEICGICVVFGWRELTNNTMPERDQSYDFEVAYIKPGVIQQSRETTFSITDREGTARKGPDKDYILNTASVSISIDNPGVVSVMFRVDGLALEPQETLQLRLEPTNNSPSGDGIFCITNLDLVIKDADVVEVGFSEAEYLANEQDETLEVAVVKNSRIATDLILTVSPVTSSGARNLGQFPQRVVLPDDNGGRSPIDADLKDFNATVQKVTFAADEFDEEPNNETVLQIGVTDDEINEALEQNFVVIMNVTDTINAEHTRVSGSSSICRIIDNDPIRIGFEMERHNVTEPQSNERIEIFIAKENDVQSEQTFQISFQVFDSVPPDSDFTPAELGVDYNLPSGQLTFNPDLQRLPLTIELLADRIPEETEAFQITSRPQGDPDYTAPSSPLFQQTTVIIEDDDIIVTIGFENTSYTIVEDIGSLEVCVRVFEPNDRTEIPIERPISVVAETSAGTADNMDYSLVTPDVILLFDNTTRRSCFTINIVNDNLVEGVEQFSLEILQNPSESFPIDTVLSPNMSIVDISDQDEATIGFLETTYTAVESSEFVILMFGFISGGIQEPVEVSLTLSSESALAGDDFVGAGDTFVFDISTTTFIYNVTMVDDDVYEFNESILAQLSLLRPVERVSINPPSTQIQIVDDDVVVFGFNPDSYTVDESAGTVNIGVEFLTGSFGTALISVQLTLSTVDGTANGSSALKADFQSILQQTLTFAESSRTQPVAITIINDVFPEINETFEVILRRGMVLVGGVERLLIDNEDSRIQIQPATATIEILDNDVIVLGWDQPMYTTSETNQTVELCASVTSMGELQIAAFQLNVQYFDISATQNVDYGTSITIGPFSQNSSRACVTLQISDDGRAENVESFRAMLVASANAPPLLSIRPANTTVNILDNDVISIGWERPAYRTNEESDTVELCAVVRSLSRSEINRDTFSLPVGCSPGSAMLNDDYQQCSSTIGPFDLTVDPPRACIQVDIIDDQIPEDQEYFTATLSSPSDPLLRVDPDEDVTNVAIFDNDVIQVTLDPTPTVSVTESDNSVKMCVQIISPPNNTAIQRTPFFVSISTMDGTAVTPTDYMGINVMNFGPFSDTIRRRCVDIPIVLDSVPENDEDFKVTLSENIDGVAVNAAGSMTTVTIIDSIRRVNDSVIGDPLMTVPIFLPNTSVSPALGENEILSLCYEVHGDSDANFNLVSDGCVSVNAHYALVRPTESQNIINAVYVRAVDSVGTCRNITVSLEGCSAAVDGVNMSRFSMNNVSVRRYSNRVRIAVPNCQDLQLVLWVICERRTFWSSNLGPGGQEVTFDADMIKFVIARGYNLQETSHGILGQFWNIPVTVTKFESSDPSQNLYTVTVDHPGGSKRSFVGMLWPLTWDYSEKYCIYVGNGQAGPLDDSDTGGGPNDPVIEGEYYQYRVDSEFSTDFDFTHFNENMCV